MDRDTQCERIGSQLMDRHAHLAVAESLTGGMLTNAFAAAPAASEWFTGGVVAYQKAVKFGLLGVPEGPVVTEKAAITMARGALRVLGGEIAVAVTGAGGPDPQDGQPPGTVWIAVVSDGDEITTRHHRFDGDPPQVCEDATTAAVALLAHVMDR